MTARYVLDISAVHQGLVHALGILGREKVVVGVARHIVVVGTDHLLVVDSQIGVSVGHFTGGVKSLVQEIRYLGGIVVGEVSVVVHRCTGPSGSSIGHERSAGEVFLKCSLIKSHTGLEQQCHILGDAVAASGSGAVRKEFISLVEVSDDEAGHLVTRPALGCHDQRVLGHRLSSCHDREVT